MNLKSIFYKLTAISTTSAVHILLRSTVVPAHLFEYDESLFSVYAHCASFFVVTDDYFFTIKQILNQFGKN